MYITREMRRAESSQMDRLVHAARIYIKEEMLISEQETLTKIRVNLDRRTAKASRKMLCEYQ